MERQPERVPRHKNQEQADYLCRIVDFDDWWDQSGQKLLIWMSMGTQLLIKLLFDVI